MGCNCGKRSATQQAAVTRARRDAADAVAPGFTSDNPILLGDEQEGSLKRVRVLQPVEGLPSGSAKYVEGSLVEQLIADGALYDITDKTQAGRVWMVGGTRYLSYEDALRVGEALGQTPVEIA